MEQLTADDSVGLYIRVSSAPQNEDLQRESSGRLLGKVPDTNIKEYVDHGVSATKRNMQDRPGLQSLIRDMVAGKVTTVVVYARDRIARDHFEWIRFWRIAMNHNIKVMFTMTGHPPLSPDVTMELIYALFAFEEGRKIRQRTSEAIYLAPPKLIGYVSHNDEGKRTYEVDDDAARVLETCFMAATQCKTAKDLTNFLEDFRRRLKVSAERLIRILTDERYTGTVLDRDGKVRFPKLIEPEIFRMVSQNIERLLLEYDKTRERPLFTPSCGICDRPMTIRETATKSEWTCNREHKLMKIDVPELNHYVSSWLEKVVQSIDPKMIAASCVAEIDRIKRRLKREARYTERRLDDLSLNLAFNKRRGPKYHELRSEFDQLSQKLIEYQRDISDLEHEDDKLSQLIDMFTPGTLEQLLNQEMMHKVASIVLESVTVHPGEVCLSVAYSELWKITE